MDGALTYARASCFGCSPYGTDNAIKVNAFDHVKRIICLKLGMLGENGRYL